MILDRPEEPGKKYALTYTILVHVGLIVALFLGCNGSVVRLR